MNDPYKVLGISATATDEEIKSAYRSLAKKFHPDVNNGSAAAEAKMKELNEAYTIIMQQRRSKSSAGDSSFRGSTSYNGYSRYASEFQAIRRYLQAGHYQEALHILSTIPEHSAELYYLSACANLMAGFRVEALNHASIAVRMEPSNIEYNELLNHLQGSRDFYNQQTGQNGFACTDGSVCSNPFLSCCAINLICNCLCGGCGGGYYRRC